MTEISQPDQVIVSDTISIGWEIPQLPQSIEGQDPNEYISPDLVNTLRGERVESGQLQDEIKRIYGRTGTMVHNAILELLKYRDTVYVSDGIRLIYSRDSMKCVFESLDPESVEMLKSTLTWICLLFRCPVDNELCVSRGQWNDKKFTLLPLRPVDWRQSCFKKLFIHGIVATIEESIPRHPVLSATMPIMFLLTGVNYAIPVGEGIIFYGVFSAMIPMRKLSDGSILWHVENDQTRSSNLRVSQIQALKRPWYKTKDVNFLQQAPALLGWCADGVFHLGCTYPPPMTWSVPTDTQAWEHIQTNMQLSVPLIKYLTTAISATFTRVRNRLPMGPPENYAQLLENSAHMPWMIYDESSKRAWLVPEVSLLHEMVLSYANLVGKEQFPTVTTISDSSFVLSEYQDEIIFSRGTTTISVKDLVLRFVAQLALIQPIAIRGGRVYGHGLMDIVRGKYSVEPDIITLRPRPSWTPLLKKIPCLLASNVGNVITAKRRVHPVCNELIAQHNFLGATVKSINEISTQCGQQRLDNSTRRLPGGFWECEKAFTSCNDSQQSDSSCWGTPSFVQSITKREKGGTDLIPNEGVVVFGGEGGNMLKDIFRAS